MREDMSGDTGNPYQPPGTFNSTPGTREPEIVMPTKQLWIERGYTFDPSLYSEEQLSQMLDGWYFDLVNYNNGGQFQHKVLNQLRRTGEYLLYLGNAPGILDMTELKNGPYLLKISHNYKDRSKRGTQ